VAPDDVTDVATAVLTRGLTLTVSGTVLVTVVPTELLVVAAGWSATAVFAGAGLGAVATADCVLTMW
jgi:hypothetical protein